MAILREVTKEKDQKVYNKEYDCEIVERVKLYDSLPLTLNRIAKISRKTLKTTKLNDKEEKLYSIGNQGLFNLEQDIKLILWDIYCKITHIPTQEKILSTIYLLSGKPDNYKPTDYFCREHVSLLENLTIQCCGYTLSKEKNEKGYYDIIITDEKLHKMNDASEKEIISFCIKEYRKAIKLIQKTIDENTITCEIVGDCYLDNW